MAMKKEEVLKRIREIGLLPVLRANSVDEALALAEAIEAGGVTTLEVTMTVPGAIEVIRQLARETNGRILIGAGTVLGVQWGDWLGVIVVVMVYTLAVTALGLALSVLVRSSGQAVGISLLATMILAPLGGAWWPLSLVPAWMRTIGQISPIYWSQQAFSQMIFYGAHLTDVLLPVGILLAFAAVFFGFGVTRFRYE